MAPHEIEARRKKTGEDETKLERERGDKRGRKRSRVTAGQTAVEVQETKVWRQKNAQNKTRGFRETEQEEQADDVA